MLSELCTRVISSLASPLAVEIVAFPCVAHATAAAVRSRRRAGADGWESGGVEETGVVEDGWERFFVLSLGEVFFGGEMSFHYSK